ncbi:hypothetical protein SAM40697_4229 [Streptomyces ambofaciens]|uniref:Uncharacterized protein n=1 Tax=Streptomyces ambofaciens TaxID=1889 RepID=A0ABN4PA90_STRAM|nr:hypothetical protein SAM40697_4229 [Streptomyces ambofaciens]
MALPVGVRCVTRDGTGTEPVPGRVNPVVLGGPALLVLALGSGTLAGVRPPGARPAGEHGGVGRT